MNIYQKLQKMRVELQNMRLKKTGENKFAGYKYYELGDILPAINQLMLNNEVAGIVTFGGEYASLKLVNCENPEEAIEFTSPMAGVTLKGAHEIQNLGAIETYQRRYLYMMAFEVVESDFFDATQGKPEGEKKEPKRKSKLSKDIADKLNEAVMAYSSLTETPSKEILERVRKETGKTPATMTDEDGFAVLELLKVWSDEFIESIGA